MIGFTEERVEQFLELERAGTSTGDMAAVMGMSVRTVNRWRTRLGVNRAEYGGRIADDVRARARVLIEDGCSFQDAARTVGVYPGTLKRWFPDIPRWSKSDAGKYARLCRQMNALFDEGRGRSDAAA